MMATGHEPVPEPERQPSAPAPAEPAAPVVDAPATPGAPEITPTPAEAADTQPAGDTDAPANAS